MSRSVVRADRLALGVTVLTVVAVIVILAWGLRHRVPLEIGVGTPFPSGIVVDSSADRGDTHVGDGTCADETGSCTLRAAIEESNRAPGTQTIRFRISGVADYWIDGHAGYSIRLRTLLPDIADTVVVDGASQPGSRRNTAPAPRPMNGRHLVEVVGTPAMYYGFRVGSGGRRSVISGLVIGGFTDGDAIHLIGGGVRVEGNYLGTDPSGTIAQPNEVGVNNGGRGTSQGAQVGGVRPAARNLIVGSGGGRVATAAYPQSGWRIRGNYFGLAADGLTPLATSTPGGSGVLSIDDCADVVVGGAEPGATNVFGESLGHGIAPHNARSLRIEGNIIGTSWNGKQRLGNLAQASIGTGITLRESRDVLIRNNVVEGWKKGGVYVGRDSRDVRLEHNVVRGNNRTGVVVHGAAQVVVTSNVVESNGSGILMILSTSVRVAGNTIQRNMGPGIETLLSTQTAVRANVVQGNGS